MAKIHVRDDAKLYRIVKLSGCPEGNIANLNAKAFSARKPKAMSLYLSTEDTPQEALDNYIATTKTDPSKIVGVVAVTAKVFRKFGAEVVNDRTPVDSHVKASWEDNDDYKDMQRELLQQAKSFGWQLGPLITSSDG